LKSLRQYDEAIQQLEQISYHFPKDSFLSNAFMEIYFLKSSSLKKTNPDESSVLLEKSYQIVLQALQSNPNNEFLKKYHARILLRQDRYEEALVILNELQQRNPSASDYDEMAAVANLRLDRFENALRHSQRLYSMDSEDPVNLDHLARSLIGLGRYQEAAETIEKGILNGLSDNLTWINLAKAYEMLNEYDKAIEILQVIQKKETHNYFVKNTLNRVQEKKRNNDKEKK
jgi:tetratricopeptide (TPR) repeat protein